MPAGTSAEMRVTSGSSHAVLAVGFRNTPIRGAEHGHHEPWRRLVTDRVLQSPLPIFAMHDAQHVIAPAPATERQSLLVPT